MTITDGPYPALIDYADIVTGMHIRATGIYPDGFSSVSNDGWVLAKDSSTLQFAGGGPALAIDGSTSIPGLAFEQGFFQLMEEFTGDPTEPTAGSVVRAADGIVYQRSPLPSDPTASIWHPMGSTTVVNWATITASGEPTLLLDGSTQ